MTTGVEFSILDRELTHDVLADLHRLAADQSWLKWSDDSYLFELPEKWHLSRLARGPDGNILGYALCSRKDDSLWLHRLVVSPHHRGQGIGQKIVDELEKVAVKNSLNAVSLKTPEDNNGALRFYHRLGFSVGPSEKGYVSMTRPHSTSQAKAVGIHQPNFLPWLGYFYKMHLSDVFIILDDVSTSSGSYVNRTGILVQGQQSWLTVPIPKKGDLTINKITQVEQRWVKKHLKTLQGNYCKTSFYETYFGPIAEVLEKHAGGSLANMNIDLITLIAKWIGLHPQIHHSSKYELQETSDDRLIQLVQLTGGNHYISGKGGGNYQDPEKFRTVGIELSYSTFKPAPYFQRGAKEFVPGLSVIDALFNIGADGIREQFSNADELAKIQELTCPPRLPHS